MRGYRLLFTAFLLIICPKVLVGQAPVITPKTGPIKLALGNDGALTVSLSTIATVTAGTGNSVSVKLNPSTLDCSLLGPQKITITATGMITTPANVKFNNPCGIATDAGGNIYVADYGNSRIRKIDIASGDVTTFAGRDPGYAEGDAASAKFLSTFKVAVDKDNNVYVIDGVIDANGFGDVYAPRLRKIGANNYVSTFAGGTPGLKDGKGPDARFLTVGGVVAGPSGNLYTSDASNLRRISPTGVVTTLLQIGGYAPTDTARLSMLGEVAVDAAENVYVADKYNNNIWKYGNDGKLTILARGDKLGFTVSVNLTCDAQGNVYTADLGGVIRKINPKGQASIFADNSVSGVNSGRPFSIKGMACDATGSVYVTDVSQGAKIWKISPAGLVTLLAGSDTAGWQDGNIGGTLTGGSSTAQVPVTVISTPVITSTFKDVNIFANSLGKAVLPDYASTTKTTDNCAASMVTVTQSPAAGTAIDVNTSVTVTITATDTGGGTASASFQVTAVDRSAPVITPIASPVVIYLDATGHKTVKVPDIATVTSDINPNPYATVTPSVLDCSMVGLQKLKITANDGMTNPVPTTLSTPYAVVADAQENLYVTDQLNHVIRKITPAGYVTIFAGSGAAGNLDGAGTSANFDTPKGIAIDKDGNLYIADQKNNNIRKISPAGVVTTLAGLGTAGAVNGPAATATFNGPVGIAVAANGNVYVADAGNNRIRMIDVNGMVSTIAGEGSLGGEDGVAIQASFYNPKGIAVNTNGIFVADGSNKIRMISNGTVTTIAGGKFPGSADGTGQAASFTDLYDIFSSNGQLFVADGGNNAIRSAAPAGTVSTYVGNTAASLIRFPLNYPTGLTVGPSGSMYIVDAANDRIVKVSINGVVQPLALTFAPNSTGSTTGNQSIREIAVQVQSTPTITTVFPDVTIAADENCVGILPDYAAKAAYSTNCSVPVNVTQFPAAGTVLGVNSNTKVTITVTDANGGTQNKSFTVGVIEKGPFITALPGPLNFKLDANGHKTISWTDVATVFSCISPSPAVKLSPATFDCSTMGKQSVVVSASTNGSFTASKPGNAAFYYPLGIATDPMGNFYIADSYNHRIRKMSPTGEVTTLAGSGEAGSVDGVGTSASFLTPVALVLDAGGNLFVADQKMHRIRKVTPQGIVSTFAGDGKIGSSNGLGTAASFSSPSGLAIDASGNLYVGDQGNNMIRKITPQGLVSTVAGGGPLPAFNQPCGVALDAAGNIYVGDTGNNRIRKIATDGTITTVAGAPAPGKADGVGPEASFYNPIGLVVDALGNIFVTDQNNNKIRQISPAGVVTTLAGSGENGAVDGQGDKAKFYFPSSLVFGKSGDLFVTDSYNSSIRAVSPTGLVRTVAGTGVGEFVDGNVGTDLLGSATAKTIEVNILNDIAITSSTADITAFAYNTCPAVVPDLTKTATAASFCSAIPVTFTQSPIAGTPLTVGVPVAVTLTASDRTGASATASIKVIAVTRPDPSIIISAPVTEVCVGNPVTFTAVPQNIDATAAYQWLVNGTVKGTNSLVFTSATLADGDRVTCQLSVNNGCTPVSSNSVQVRVIDIPTITMKPDISINSGDIVQLAPIINAKNATYSWLPATGLDNPAWSNPKASPLTTTKYTLTVTTPAGCSATASVTVNILTPLVVPNSFTPNGDGTNDLWVIKNIINYPDCVIDVFGRYGKQMFHSVGYATAWDGRFNGVNLPTGTYYYIIQLPKQRQTLSGSISIIR